MRELKFRVYDFINQKFDDQVYNAGELFGHPSCVDWVAQQYTGLKDSKGKAIFEGDIVKDNHTNHPEYQVGLVVFDSGYFGIKYNWTGFRTPFLFGLAEEVEIIGNIMENSELFKNNEN